MSKKSDDSIERIFRQVVSQYDTTFKENDWLKIEKLLDEELSRKAAARSKRIKGTAYTLTGLTGLIIAVYFLAFNKPSDSIGRLNNSTKEVQAAGDLESKGNAKKETPSAGLLSSVIPEDSAKVQINKNETKLSDDASAEGSVTSSSGRIISQKSSSEKKLKEATSLENKAHLQPALDDRIANRGGVFSEQSLKSDERSGLTATDINVNPKIIEGVDAATEDNSSPGRPDQTENLSDQSSVVLPGISDKKKEVTSSYPEPGIMISDSALSLETKEVVLDSQKNPINKDGVPIVLEKNTFSTEKVIVQDRTQSGIDSLGNSSSPSAAQEKNKPASRWSLGLVFAPEFSTTRLSHYSTPGESLGLRIGYQISNRFNINTGVIRSTKKYKDNGSEYSPNPGYWNSRTNGIVPEEIDSRCLVLEVPLEIQFDVIQRLNSRAFVSTAISSYFMLNQSYQYSFESPNPGAANGWESPGSESYWFSVGMISAGYERYVYRSLAIGIEPFLKISLSEIGWPNIKLYSTGAYVTLRYKFATRENRESFKKSSK